MFDQEVKNLLDRIAEGRPGTSELRFGKHWSRTDLCPG